MSGAVAVGFMEEVPGVEQGTRTTFVFDGDTYLDEDGNKLRGTLVCADTCFFKVFDRPILAGDPEQALSKWGCVMVSRSFAEKLVDEMPGQAGHDVSSVIGKQIANADMDGLKLTIEGVFEDFPKNGSLDYDILLSMETYGKQSTDNWLGNDRYKGYVKLMPGIDPNTLTEAIRKMQEAHQPLEQIEAQGTSLKYFLKPFSNMHTSSPEVKTQVILLSIVAALLIIISLLNYILIVISSMVKRSKEVGVRKCYGAEGKHIYGMLTKEALLHIVLSLVIAAIIIFAGRGIVENLLGVPFQTLLVSQSIMAIAAVLLFVLVISIVVPAELYQRIPVYAALKNYTENSRRWKLGLLGVQVLINVFLVVMMLIIGRQYQKVSNADTGYDYKNLYYFDLFDGDRQAQVRAVETLKRLPEVSGVAATNNLPYMGSNGDNVSLPEDDRELFNIADQYDCSPEFYDLMGIRFLEGRAPRDSSEVVVDEKFVQKMAEFADWNDGAVGKQVFITGHEENGMMDKGYFTISGVYKSYLIGNLQGVDERPSALFYGEIGSMSSWMPHILFKVRPEALENVRGALNEALPDKEINIVSYEEQMRAAYADSKKMRNTMALGAVFSLLIALLGLIGFIKDESLRRSKEMAVRKINGATTRDILSVFASDILKLSTVMAVIACIAAYFVAHKWLEQFAEKVSLNPLYFIGGALLVLTIVLGVVVLNCLRIARANPVESLKNE
ncbi:MAG: FtsX-like permease family protein [Bacteroidales bacterium]|nr:FtsX-like permease family protein [Bacteroidales bacterium]MDY2860115.1 FtsX-like permease family protein [Candidatus Cryptobacteroides sp.]MDY5442372.1 FtsX-like permease family protein [Candidatus Cryptobacteroides sp.]